MTDKAESAEKIQKVLKRFIESNSVLIEVRNEEADSTEEDSQISMIWLMITAERLDHLSCFPRFFGEESCRLKKIDGGYRQ